MGLALSAVAVTDTPAAVQFIQPIRPLALTASGSVDVALRVRVEPHPENRWLDVDIYQDDVRVGGFGDPLHGSDGPAIYPVSRSSIQRLAVGRYVFTARACRGTKVEGPRTVCDRVRASASMRFQVCGGAETDEC